MYSNDTKTLMFIIITVLIKEQMEPEPQTNYK